MFNSILLSAQIYAGKNLPPHPPREGLLPVISGLYWESPPERATFRVEVYERVGISRAEV